MWLCKAEISLWHQPLDFTSLDILCIYSLPYSNRLHFGHKNCIYVAGIKPWCSFDTTFEPPFRFTLERTLLLHICVKIFVANDAHSKVCSSFRNFAKSFLFSTSRHRRRCRCAKKWTSDLQSFVKFSLEQKYDIRGSRNLVVTSQSAIFNWNKHFLPKKIISPLFSKKVILSKYKFRFCHFFECKNWMDISLPYFSTLCSTQW